MDVSAPTHPDTEIATETFEPEIPAPTTEAPEPTPEKPRRAILIRCHFIDDALRATAARLQTASDYDIIFAIDAKSGVTKIDNFRTLVISKLAYAKLGLLLEEDTLWKCGDYILYLARKTLPEYDAFWLLDYDIAISRSDPLDFFKTIDAASQHDFVASYVRPAEEHWPWRRTMEGPNRPQVYRCFFPLLRITATAIDFLFRERLNAAAAKQPNADWPNDEVFTATALRHGGFTIVDFNELGNFYEERNFGHGTMSHPSEIPANNGKLYHPVRRGGAYLDAVYKNYSCDPLVLVSRINIEWSEKDAELPLVITLGRMLADLGDNPKKLLEPHSVIASLLQHNESAAALLPITRAFAKARMPDCLDLLREQFHAAGRPKPRLLDNIALAKPAWQSSVSQYSHIRDPRRDAEGGNNGVTTEDYGFHTATEQYPWWTTDLKSTYAISEIVLYNRRVFPERLRGFEVKLSLDGREWQTIFRDKARETPSPQTSLKFPDRPTGRYLRIEIPGRATLHFLELEAFGTPTK